MAEKDTTEVSIKLTNIKLVKNRYVHIPLNLTEIQEAPPKLDPLPEFELTIPEIEIKGAFAPEIALALAKLFDKYQSK